MAEKKEIKLVGFHLNKINAEKKEITHLPDKALEIKSNINIIDVEKFKPEISKQESLKIKFSFDIDYTELGKISLEGTIFLILNNYLIKEALSAWKQRRLPNELQEAVMNIIIQKASLRAFQLEEEINLPLHLQIPRVKIQSKPE